jgi:protein CpxP
MKPFTLIAPVLLAASLTTVSLATAQQSPPPAPHGEHGMPGPDRDDGPDHGPGHDHGMPPRGPMLTEAQQDKLFALHHAAEPAQREREKAMRHAYEALREMAGSGKFDDAKAAALAQTIGQAAAADALDHAREQAQFLAILTPEQRAKMQEERAQHGPGKRP